MPSDRTLGLVHVSHVGPCHGFLSLREIADQRPVMASASKESVCRRTKSAPCAHPGDCAECDYGETFFCAARLRDAGIWWDGIQKRDRLESEPGQARALNIPESMWGMIGIGMENPSVRSTMSEPMRFLLFAARRRLVVIHGPDGTGKSTAAAMWCWTRKGWYYRATGLRWWTKPGRGWNRDDGDDVRLLRQRSVAIVGLDKPWANKEGPHRHNLMHILRERFENGLFTLVTSNLGTNDIEGLIGTGLARTTRNANAIAQVTELMDGGKAEAEDRSAF